MKCPEMSTAEASLPPALDSTTPPNLELPEQERKPPRPKGFPVFIKGMGEGFMANRSIFNMVSGVLFAAVLLLPEPVSA